ncbi:hypothetical protein GNP93_21995 [Paenibacillus validus]|uniref:Uncharacterized protein n=2 Tax=Paenibacillus TaxID=44249 RepID=A0A7X2ZED7_9BACL|nr:hypothetical protein [Paenibacillus validus]
MPMYTQDNATYYRQMYEWHMKMHHYQEQLRGFHLERAKYFQGLVEEREKAATKSNDGPAA